ncbi:MAG: hypothetical protein RLZZ69_2596 [Cyanobacteriota bacterium]
MSTQRHIVAMGGGGWGMEPDNPLLDFYIYNIMMVKLKEDRLITS